MKTKTLWCFLNINNPIVAWEVAIGRISSIPQGSAGIIIPKGMIHSYLSSWQASRLSSAIDTNDWSFFKFEMEMESYRNKHFSSAVSRMKGCYFFESKEMALNVRNHLKWNWMKDEHLSSITFIYENDHDLSLYDVLWIVPNMNDEEKHSYFAGKTKFDSPAQEILAYGRGIIQNEELIIKAEKTFLSYFPRSELILKSAKLIFEDRFLKNRYYTGNLDWFAYHAAQIFPLFHLDKSNKSSGKISYIMNQQAFEIYGCIHDEKYEPVLMPDLRKLERIIPLDTFNSAIN